MTDIDDDEPCRTCFGSGEAECPECDGMGVDDDGNDCQECGGCGVVDCPECG